jgi:hypothetical protein
MNLAWATSYPLSILLWYLYVNFAAQPSQLTPSFNRSVLMSYFDRLWWAHLNEVGRTPPDFTAAYMKTTIKMCERSSSMASVPLTGDSKQARLRDAKSK